MFNFNVYSNGNAKIVASEEVKKKKKSFLLQFLSMSCDAKSEVTSFSCSSYMWSLTRFKKVNSKGSQNTDIAVQNTTTLERDSRPVLFKFNEVCY